METKEIIETLTKYKKICDEAIEEAQKNKMEGAINWGDLQCFECKYSLSVDGDWCYQFYISEADPDNELFYEFISNYILERVPDWTPIQVFMEW